MLRVPSAGAEFGECTPKAGIELGANGSIFPRPKGKPRMGRMWYIGIGHRALLPVGCVASIGAGRCELPAPVRRLQHFKADPFCVPSRRINTTDPRPYQPPPNTIKITMMRIRSVVVSILASC